MFTSFSALIGLSFICFRNLCLNTVFRCQSYDYNATGAQVCRLSHHSSITLTQIRDPFLPVPGAMTKELSACYNVSVDCRAGDMIATVRTSKIFHGKLYAKGAPNSCAVDVDNSLEFVLRLPYTDLECGVQRESMGRYTTEVSFAATFLCNQRRRVPECVPKCRKPPRESQRYITAPTTRK